MEEKYTKIDGLSITKGPTESGVKIGAVDTEIDALTIKKGPTESGAPK